MVMLTSFVAKWIGSRFGDEVEFLVTSRLKL
jgi:hypothetical protein